jgi:DNA-binding response OmpR family regulator
MITAIDEETSHLMELSAGVNRFFTKPLNVTLLESSISELIAECNLPEENGKNNSSLR